MKCSMDAVQQLRKANPGFLDPVQRVQTESSETPEEIQRLWNHFKRYADLNDRRMKALQDEISEKDKILKEVFDYVSKEKDKKTVQSSRENLARQQSAISREPLTHAIDRTGVAPADVQLDKIFYTGR